MLRPIIFSSKNQNRYLYDIIDNRIIFLNPSIDMEKILDSFVCMKKSKNMIKFLEPNENEGDYIELKNMIFKYEKVNELIRGLSDKVQIELSDIKSKMSIPSQLILKVTDFCNFKCTYCTYSDSNDDYSFEDERVMSDKIAISSIDYFFKLINSNERITRYGKKTISFYGGEPLLNFRLIKKCVEYVKSYRARDKICFNMTTNASLIKDRILDYLIENDIRLLISLDGPKEEHDCHRSCKNDPLKSLKIYPPERGIK